jgi:hypothetical protein
VEGLRHAFALEGPHGPLTEADRELLRRLALAIVVRRMGAPAVLFLQSLRPLNYIGSQAMIFLRPFLTPLFNREQYERLRAILERRQGLAALIDAIESAAAERKREAE